MYKNKYNTKITHKIMSLDVFVNRKMDFFFFCYSSCVRVENMQKGHRRRRHCNEVRKQVSEGPTPLHLPCGRLSPCVRAQIRDARAAAAAAAAAATGTRRDIRHVTRDECWTFNEGARRYLTRLHACRFAFLFLFFGAVTVYLSTLCCHQHDAIFP